MTLNTIFLKGHSRTAECDKARLARPTLSATHNVFIHSPKPTTRPRNKGSQIKGFNSSSSFNMFSIFKDKILK